MSASKIVKFSYNWNNKLHNKAFTTIRIHNPKKYIVGELYNIELNGRFQGKAILQEKRVLRTIQLNEFICFIDTGYNRQETIKIIKKMYKNLDLQTARFDFCLFVYQSQVKKPENKQTSLNI